MPTRNGVTVTRKTRFIRLCLCQYWCQSVSVECGGEMRHEQHTKSQDLMSPDLLSEIVLIGSLLALLSLLLVLVRDIRNTTNTTMVHSQKHGQGP